MTARIEIKMDNAAFDDAPASELSRILRGVADDLENGVMPEQIRLADINGNRVGSFKITGRANR